MTQEDKERECKKCGRVFGSVKCFDVDCPNNTPNNTQKITMNQEDKELLLKDLCARLPYGVKISVNDKIESLQGINVLDNVVEYGSFLASNIEEIKPYLFPLSSMTKEQWDKEFRGYGITEFTRDSFKYGCETFEFYDSNPSLSSIVGFTNQLIKNHFDIYGLIPKNLANDATGLNIY